MDEKQRILIVDDIDTNLKILVSLLQHKNHIIDVANSGSEALNMAKDYSPDLILLDIIMPDMDGFDVCRSLKKSAVTKDIPIIFLTARNETEDIIKGFEIGAMDYVTKPFNAAELLARVRTHLALKRSRDVERNLIRELQEALTQVKQLSGMLPICSGCKKIRDDKGYWQQVEKYIGEHTEATFSHSLCPDCLKRLYPEQSRKMLSDKP